MPHNMDMKIHHEKRVQLAPRRQQRPANRGKQTYDQIRIRTSEKISCRNRNGGLRSSLSVIGGFEISFPIEPIVAFTA
jgi:hypothetical protein